MLSREFDIENTPHVDGQASQSFDNAHAENTYRKCDVVKAL